MSLTEDSAKNWIRRELTGAVYVIAEIGVNHGGNVSLAVQMVDAAQRAGADAVKFQTFSADRLALPNTPKVAYQTRTTPPGESHAEMLRGLELSEEGHQKVFDHCRGIGIDFLSTPYDLESVHFLEQLGVTVFKSASADIVDLPLQQALASTGRQVLLSTGMASLEEISAAVDCHRALNRTPVLLHCVSNYPCSDGSVNLRVLPDLRDRFGLPVGFSDHTLGSVAAVAAVALGAPVIERHFTLDRDLPGPDHAASSDPVEFADFVRSIRRAEAMLGTQEKRCQPEESEMAKVSRKSIVTSRALPEGHIIAPTDLALRRPGTGLSPAHLSHLVGRRTARTLDAWSLLGWEDVS